MEAYVVGSIWHIKNIQKTITINRHVQWEELELLIPAIYVCDRGLMLDLCIRIPLEQAEQFYAKWDQQERESLPTQEAFEQMERENPFSPDFIADLLVNGKSLPMQEGCGEGWHPLKLEDDYISAEAEDLMQKYNLCRTDAWCLSRHLYTWKSRKQININTIELLLKGEYIPFTASHFTTTPDCTEDTIKLTHPQTNQTYGLILHKCERDEMAKGFTGLPKGMELPHHYQVLTYSINPLIGPEELSIQDCISSDQPRKRGRQKSAASVAIIGGADGPTSIFIAGKSNEEKAADNLFTAYSSLHFEPVSDVRWRAVFQIKNRADKMIPLYPLAANDFTGPDE